jgi:hypothetical protein
VPVFDGSQRTHVDYKINEDEATIVREVFEARASGDGYRTIAKRLDFRRVSEAQSGSAKRRTCSASRSNAARSVMAS